MAQNSKIKITSDQSFESDVLQTKGLELVDFWAEWCGPCKKLAPTLDELADDYQGKIGISKLDVDANPSTAARYQIRGIPTVLIFRNGQLVDRVVGAVSKEVLKNNIDKHIG